MKNAHLRLIAVMLAATGLGASLGESRGASFDLSSVQLRSAIRLGQASAGQPDFATEWTSIAAGGHRLIAATPFYQVVSMAREAAIAGQASSEDTVRASLERTRGRLLFRLEMKVRGPEEARDFKPELAREGEPPLAAVTAVNELYMRERGIDGRYTAHCAYGFAVSALDSGGKYLLRILDRGMLVASFPIDLSSLR